MAAAWMQTGEASEALAQKEKAAAAQREAERGKAFRYWLKKEEEGDLIFCDGDLGPKGYLTPPRFYEHTINFQGKWQNFICPEQSLPGSGEKCPLCAGVNGKSDRPSLVSLFTVLDLRQVTGKNDKVYPWTRKLFVAKKDTFEILNKIAVKKDGLRGLQLTATRTGEKSPSVGSNFIPDVKHDLTAADFRAKYTRTFKVKDPKTQVESEKMICGLDVLKYDNEVTFRTGDELRKILGGGVMASEAMVGSEGVGSTEDIANEL